MVSSIYPLTVNIGSGTGFVSAVTVTKGGSGYTSNPIVAFTGGGGTGAAASAVLASGVTSYTVTAGGTGFTSAPAVGITGGGGTGAAATAVIDGRVTSVAVDTAGSGYNPATISVSFTGGGGSGATATATLSGGGVGAINVTSGGTGYTSAPTVTIHDDSINPGTGATATATITSLVVSITPTAEGTGFTSAPTIALTGGGGTGATATATISNYVASVGITNPGTGYSGIPAVSFTGGGGTGAAATASIIHGILAATNIFGSDIAISSALVRPGGGGILRLSFAFDFGVTPAAVSIFNNGKLKGTLNADNSNNLISDGYYRFDIDVEAGDNINMQSSQTVDLIHFVRAHLVLLGA